MSEFKPVIRVDKGSDFGIEITVPTPYGDFTACLPLSEAARMTAHLAQVVADQTGAMNTELQKWISTG